MSKQLHTTPGNTDVGKVSVTIDRQIARISFYHPHHNALPTSLLAQLSATIQQLGFHSGVRLLVLQSEGDKSFCAGAHFDELLTLENQDEATAFFSGFAELINAMRQTKQLIIGRIHGKAIGGGLGLLAACDYCFANAGASLRLSELSVGMGPFVIGPALIRKMGVSAFTELALHPILFKTASWGLEKGLYHTVHEQTAHMDEAIQDFCEELLGYSPLALEEIKKMCWKDCRDWDVRLMEQAAISGKLLMEEKTKELLKNFKQSRLRKT